MDIQREDGKEFIFVNYQLRRTLRLLEMGQERVRARHRWSQTPPPVSGSISTNRGTGFVICFDGAIWGIRLPPSLVYPWLEKTHPQRFVLQMFEEDLCIKNDRNCLSARLMTQPLYTSKRLIIDHGTQSIQCHAFGKPNTKMLGQRAKIIHLWGEYKQSSSE